MTTRLLALVLVLGLLPTGQLVASLVGAEVGDSCADGAKGDICPGHCCPKTAHTCRCHDSPCIARIEPTLDVLARVDKTAPICRIDHDGRGSEPPPVPPPIA